MNDLAKELLIQAGLSGHKQILYRMHDKYDGDCAMGVLHLSLHQSREEAMADCHHSDEDLRKAFGLTHAEYSQLTELNDQGLDFIGIARKMASNEPKT